LTQRQTRWLEEYSLFLPKIVYKPGNNNVVADALSRNPLFMNTVDISMDDSLVEDIKIAYKFDNKLSKIIDDITVKGKKVPNYSISNGLLIKKNRICIPCDKKVINKLISIHHDSKISGHLGTDKCYEVIARHFVWRNMTNDIDDFIKTCDTCQRSKLSTQKPIGLLQPLPIPSRNWEHVSMDFITALPTTETGFDSIMVVVDKLSKMSHFIPTNKNADTETIAFLFFHNIFRLHGLPRKIISDRDPKFTSNLWKHLMKLLDVNLNLSTSHHPQTDGQTERLNKTLEQMLRSCLTNSEWDTLLPSIEFAYNNSVQASTKTSPFVCVYGQNPLIPSSFVVPNIDSDSPVALDIVKNIGETIELVKENLKSSIEYQEQYSNSNRREVLFKVGEKVLLSTKNLKDPKQSEKANKLKNPYCGPFEIIQEISPVVYKLKLPKTMRIHPVFHVSQFKKYNTPDADRLVQDSPPPPRVIDIQGEYEIEKILQRKNVGRGYKYLIKWKNYPDTENTWEPKSNFNAKGLEAIKEFEGTINNQSK
jgi:hypothetical protein